MFCRARRTTPQSPSRHYQGSIRALLLLYYGSIQVYYLRFEGLGEPLLKVVVGVKHLGQQEVEQAPQFVNLVLQESPPRRVSAYLRTTKHRLLKRQSRQPTAPAPASAIYAQTHTHTHIHTHTHRYLEGCAGEDDAVLCLVAVLACEHREELALAVFKPMALVNDDVGPVERLRSAFCVSVCTFVLAKQAKQAK